MCRGRVGGFDEGIFPGDPNDHVFKRMRGEPLRRISENAVACHRVEETRGTPRLC